MIKVKLLGAKRSAANIRRMDKATRKRLFEEIKKICNDIYDISQGIVPYKDGFLKGSGKVKASPGRYPVVFVSYGNASVPYALMQHENTSFKHPGGKKAKYLEIAAKELEPTMERRLEVAVRTETKKYSMAGRVRI